MSMPQPFQYQGSKRKLAPKIVQFLPQKIRRLVEPFAGSGAISLACAARNKSQEYWLNDFNRPLSELLRLIINNPEKVAERYSAIWKDHDEDHLKQFYLIREEFNRNKNPYLLLYLLARCVKGSVRYNTEGCFNQSPDKRRLGTAPNRMRQNILWVSTLLRGKSILTSNDYIDVFTNINENDVVYMDPPYQGVCGGSDQRYSDRIEFDRFVYGLDMLNQKNIKYLVSYDGKLGDKTYGEPLPDDLNLVLLEIEAGRSSQATLLGRNSTTIESLYLSLPLANEIGVTPALLSNIEQKQMCLF